MWMLSVQTEIMNNFLSVFCSFLQACLRAEPHKAVICDTLETEL